MQGKGLIQFFTILLTLACLYSISFTFVARKVERQAVEFANGDPIKEKAYLDSIGDQAVYNLGFMSYTYQEAKEREIALGLDLKGGMNVTMEISLKELIQNVANNPKDEDFNKALENADELSKTTQTDYVILFTEELKKLAPNKTLASYFATKDNATFITQKTTDADVTKFLKKESESAIDRSFNILRTRIDKFGVSSPNIQKQQGSNRILIELPGVTDKDRVRKLLQGSAKLEFWETYDNLEIFSLLENVNSTLASVLKDTTKKEVVSGIIDTTATTEVGKLAALTGKKDSTDISSEADLSNKENPLFAVLAPSTGQGANGQQVLRPGPTIGYVALKDTALVNSYLANPAVKNIIPSNVKLAWAVKPVSATEKVFELYALKPSNLDGSAALGGTVIADARSDFDQRGNPEVIMVMNTEGARQWKRITAAASADQNNKKSIAIVLDNVVYSAPTVQNEIPNGISSITGNFQIEDTQDLANILKAGRLPAPAKIVEEAVIGPTLGHAAITAGVTSAIVGFALVLVFMIFYYNRAGLVANIAVIVNVFFIMGILASIGAVLTLPGIAGIVLTMGTAVDANVLIYERIREEKEAGGKSWRQIIADGYKHSMPSILDSQITTFLVGVILYFFGTGPIVGFATTLMIGILTSLFTSIFISRIIFEWMLNKEWKISVSFPWSANTLKNANYGFIENRKLFYYISSAAVVICLIFIFTKGFTLGVDFKGGRTYVAKFEQAVGLEKVRADLNASFGEATEVKTYGGDDQLRITTPYLVDLTDDAADNSVLEKLNEGLEKTGVSYEILSSQKVGPTIANDIKISAIYSVIFAILGIGLYILLRFKKWQYSAGAALGMIHDAIIVLGVFSIFDGILPFELDMNQSFIAAILTVLGYSINDTVVVFDRLREYLGFSSAKRTDHAEVINQAINKTLSRTIITSLTIVFVLAVLFVFGGEVIRGFSFAILIGIILGTYSSIFLSAPIVYDLEKNSDAAKQAKIVSTTKTVDV